MKRRHNTVSLFVLLLINTSSASAEDYSAPSVETYESPSIDLSSTLRIDLESYRYYEPSETDWLDSITMRQLPPGSLQYQFTGFHRFAVRHARSQYRRFVRRAARRGWYVRPEDHDHWPLFNNRAERDFVGGFNNGAWWQRSWMDSLPPEKGGAPATPVVHVYGSDTSWEWGPFTLTNGMNLRFDYIAFFELNPNPVETQGARPERRATLDIRPARETHVSSTNLRFDLKPRIRVGMPKGEDWQSILRELSLRGSVDIRHRGVTLAQGEIEVAWDPQGGVEVTFELSLIRW